LDDPSIREIPGTAWVLPNLMPFGQETHLDDLRSDIDAIVSRYQGRLAAMDAELQAELAPFQERLDVLRHAVGELQESFPPDLPDRPEPEGEEPYEGHWLFNAARDYLTQLSDYQARKATATEDAAD
jgi:hypothetical protein